MQAHLLANDVECQMVLHQKKTNVMSLGLFAANASDVLLGSVKHGLDVYLCGIILSCNILVVL